MSTCKIIKTFLLTLLIGLLALTSPALGVLKYAQGEFVVGLAPGAEIDSLNARFGTTVRHYLPIHDLYLLDAPASVNLDELCEEISKLPYVVFAHPNYLVDPMRGVQSSLPFPDERCSEEKYLDQPAVELLNLEAAQTISTGVNQVIGVVDGGVNLHHPAFGGMVVSGWDYVDNDADADEVPGGVNSGHGTFVAGVLHLMVPDATIRSYRVCDTEGEADGFLVAEAILQALADGCHVINVSLSTTAVHQAIAAVCEYAREQNVVVVCAAGNEYSDIGHYPGTDPNTLSVAAVDSTLTLADYSCYGQDVTLVAPGTDIYAPFLDEGYAWWSGTSFSAPFVAAEIAMVRSLGVSMTWDDLVGLLVGTAICVNQLNEDHSGLIGAGVLNPYGAVLNLNKQCGDLDGDLNSGIPDLAKLIDALYFSGSTSYPERVAGLDGRSLMTNNDLCALAISLFSSLSLGYCNAMLEASFPPAKDTIAVAMAEIPAFVDEWTVRILARLTAPARGVCVALAYDLPGSDIALTHIEHIRASSLGPFELNLDSSHQVVISECQLYDNPAEPLAYELARLTFAVTPSDTARRIQFTSEPVALGDATHTNVVSRMDALNEHVEGWAPQFVSDAAPPGVDSYGHVCLGLNRGDVNMDAGPAVDIADVSVLIDNLFLGGSSAIAIGEADVAPRPHPDGILDITDLQVLIDHMFISLEPLPTCYD